ncbi:ThuA domain-containing protein [Solirubrobacter sp. CPCC 204708]|uniref:ThuA domain-containing protein n=1 Tax=Solirubrobacter deserti TaxID=2282478 RepID=A0ABT4REX5_9ACTN|nr:ThuA domain-containing protein [Solirubrobacter deserti]MBE2318615.1 ThuA domain-containing protein [Solirubrobacter deserti]MDA0137073.1 ThuA domain-containing protein [Solirubrobacter deserti]
MRRRIASLALLGLAFALPDAASAKVEAQAAAPPNVLVVTSTSDEVTTAGLAAINAAAAGDTFTVTAPAPSAVGAELTPEKLDTYRAVVFLNTGQTSPLTDAQKANFEAYFKKGGGFVGIGSAIETDASWSFLTDVLGTRSTSRTELQSGSVKVFDRVHDASKDLPLVSDRTDHWYNFITNDPARRIRGNAHVLASVVEDPFGPQPQGQTLDGIAGGTMGADHPISFCKDYLGGRSFYTALGNTAAAFDANLTTHLKGAIKWATGNSDPTYSDCGATVWKNYQQTKIGSPPNLQEPIGFDQLPDGRVLQTDRLGSLRLHDAKTGRTTVIADFANPRLPSTQRIYSAGEDGLYGPAVDANFATNKWVYLFYSPQTVTDVKLSTGQVVTQTTPNTAPPNSAPSKTAWDPYVGYHQLSRFKFVEGTATTDPRLDLTTEQQILRVPMNRQECCHVAGDIDFDKHGNLWMVTGDDTPAGGINANGWGPFNSQKTDEQQTVRVTGATAGTFTLTYEGQTTAPLAFNATAAQVDAALEALSNIEENEIQTSGGPVQTGNVNVFFRRGKQQANQTQITADGAALTGGTVATTTAQEGGWYQRLTGDARRSSLNTNDLRGKILRIKVKDDFAAADANKADFTGSGAGAYTIPAGNLYPLVAGAPQAKTRPEVYAMGFRNPFRIQVDENDVAYVSDYSPDASSPARGRGPGGVGRFEIVRKPSNYGWPTCYKRDLAYYEWNFHEFAPNTSNAGTPLHNPPKLHECDGPTQRNDSLWNLEGGPTVEPGLTEVPPVTNPDIWYSYQDNPNLSGANPRLVGLGTPCQANYAPTAGTPAPGSATECPRLFPELYSGGVGPHGMTKYKYDAANPNPKKFPPYYNDAVVFGEWTQDTLREMRLDEQGRIVKINGFLDCGPVNLANPPMFECDNPMDMQFGADGAFYLLTYGNGFNVISPQAGMYKWEYSKGSKTPKAVLTADKTDGASPLTVNFSSAGSMDPDPLDSIRYEWDFGDGSPISTEANPTHTYTQRGRFTAVLTVIDSTGERASTSTLITSGNTAPTITIEAPLDGGVFSFGDELAFKVTVTDPEDPTIDCSRVQVKYVLGHDQHGHELQSVSGCTGLLQTGVDEASHGGNVFAVISAEYVDTGAAGDVPALKTTSQVQLRQRRQEVELATSQSGTSNQNQAQFPATADVPVGTHRSNISNNDWVRLNGPFNLHQIDGLTVRYTDAAAGRTVNSPLAAIEVRTGSQTGPLVTTMNLTSTGATNAWKSEKFPISLAGKHELFLVFREVAGGATGGSLFLLNWVHFEGNGVTVQKVEAPGTATGTVPPTLSLSLGAPASFEPFIPGVTRTYEASTTADVISTAGDATLSVSDPGHMTNGAFTLAKPLQVAFSKSTWNAPVSNDRVTVTFKQDIGDKDPLRTGTYSKTLTFTLSTTNP